MTTFQLLMKVSVTQKTNASAAARITIQLKEKTIGYSALYVCYGCIKVVFFPTKKWVYFCYQYRSISPVLDRRVRSVLEKSFKFFSTVKTHVLSFYTLPERELLVTFMLQIFINLNFYLKKVKTGFLLVYCFNIFR